MLTPYCARPSIMALSSLTSKFSKRACTAIYTHTFFCLSGHMSNTVLDKAVNFDIAILTYNPQTLDTACNISTVHRN